MYQLIPFFEMSTLICWSIVYVLIILSGFLSWKIKKVSMPYVIGALNMGWETCALFWTHGFWGFVLGYVIWFGLDLFIVFFSLTFLKSTRSKVLYVCTILISSLGFWKIFALHDDYFYLTAFLLSLIIAIAYIFDFKRISPHFKISIAIIKLIGDLFSLLAYGEYYSFVYPIETAVFFLNCIYLIMCLRERSQIRKQSIPFSQ